MSIWLLENSILNAMRAAPKATGEQQAAYEQSVLAEDGDGVRGLAIAGDTARISVIGTLTDAPSFMARWFGGGNTVYSDIVRAVAEAEANPGVENVEYYFASGGGQASAEWLEAMNAIKRGKKPSKAYIGAMAASAAYGLASQADEIVAQNAMSATGSVGVVTSAYLDENFVEITSSNAPDKRPDAGTEEGQATIRAMLDQIEKQFIGAIADGRGTDAENVKKNYGRGAVLYAEDALKLGMIDSISNQSTTAPTGGETTTGASIMDLNKLKAEHPAVYAQAVQAGVNQERERVEAHLEMAKASGAHEVAAEAIENGSELTSKYQAKYLAAGMNQQRAAVQAADDTTATDTTAPAADNGKDFEDEVAEALAAELGLEDEDNE